MLSKWRLVGWADFKSYRLWQDLQNGDFYIADASGDVPYGKIGNPDMCDSSPRKIDITQKIYVNEHSVNLPVEHSCSAKKEIVQVSKRFLTLLSGQVPKDLDIHSR